MTCPASVTYDGSAQEPCTATVVGAGGLSQSLTVSYANNTNVGTATASASYAGDANHAGSSGSGSFEIGKAASMTVVTVAGGASFTYDGNAHPATVLVTGAGGLNLTPDPEYSCGHAPKDVADSGCTASFTYLGDANHYGSTDSKTYTITQATPTVNVVGGTFTYDGNPHPATATATGVGGAVVSGSFTFTYTPGESSAPVNAAATAYSVSASFTSTDPNYTNATSSGSITINKKPITVTADAKSKIFGKPDPALTYTFAPALLNGDSFSGVLSRVSGENVGQYDILLGSLTAGSNYNLIYVGAKLTINPWYITGFYQPVAMTTGAATVYNTIKGGSTVPLKFNVYEAQGGTERTSTADINGFTVNPASCTSDAVEDPVDFTTTGGTSLRYDADGKQFIQNWQTPKGAGKCYRVTMTTSDGTSKIQAYFKTK